MWAMATTKPPTRFRVTVTDVHIVDGEDSSPLACPIALAVSERFPDKDVEVTEFVRVGRTRYRLSRRAEAFITQYDGGKPVKSVTLVFRRITTRYL